jgi:hypothetical protein
LQSQAHQEDTALELKRDSRMNGRGSLILESPTQHHRVGSDAAAPLPHTHIVENLSTRGLCNAVHRSWFSQLTHINAFVRDVSHYMSDHTAEEILRVFVPAFIAEVFFRLQFFSPHVDCRLCTTSPVCACKFFQIDNP